MKAFYSYQFTVTGGMHVVEFFCDYSKEKGVIGPQPGGAASSRANKVLAHVSGLLNRAQKTKLKKLMQEKVSGIVDENGDYYED